MGRAAPQDKEEKVARKNNNRVLIVVLDALRPEFVTPELMPNLYRFAAHGVRYANARSTFPTETRVNQSAVITGCYPETHGVVANKFPEGDASPGAVLNTGDDVQLEQALKRLGGRLIEVPTLGERLAAAGRTYATISAGTPGGGRNINHRAEEQGFFRLALKRPEAAAPAGVMSVLEERIGPLPDYALPALEWNSYAVSCYLDYVEPEHTPDVMLLWLSEPDETCHYLGIGSPDMLRAIAHVDAEFARILAAQESKISSGELQVIALSDHGQISLPGEPLDLVTRFADAGFAAATAPGDGNDYVLVIDTGGGVWVRDSDPALIEKLTGWLGQQDWCGPLFTREGIGGTLRHADVRIAHRRAADIALALQTSDGTNGHGAAGTSAHDSPYPAGGGCHGGLSRYELHNVLCMGGSAFAEGQVVDAPAGNIDITPTVLALLGLEAADGMDGRVLHEALREGKQEAAAPETQVISSSGGPGPASHLSVTDYAGTRYLNRAWRE
jgi:arylsulfatase A-like enzyme